MKTFLMILMLVGLSFTVGCANDAQTGAGLGAMIGAGVGAAVDDNNRWRGAAIGGAIGAGSGYIIGNESDKAKARDRYNRY